jgi:hypothetical protein
MPLKTAMFCCEIPWRVPLATWTAGPAGGAACGIAGDARSTGMINARFASRMLEPSSWIGRVFQVVPGLSIARMCVFAEVLMTGKSEIDPGQK